MQYSTINKSSNWNDTADTLNANFDKTNAAITKLENSSTRNKGYFKTSNELIKAFPVAGKGDIAYVGNNYPFERWLWNGTAWAYSGFNGGDETVPLNDYCTAVDTTDTKEYNDVF